MEKIWTPFFSPPHPSEILDLSDSALKLIAFLENQEILKSKIRQKRHLEVEDNVNFSIKSSINNAREGTSSISEVTYKDGLSEGEVNEYIFHLSNNYNKSDNKNGQTRFKETAQDQICISIQNYTHENMNEKVELSGDKVLTICEKATGSTDNTYFLCDYDKRKHVKNCLNQSVDMFEDSENSSDLVELNESTSHYFKMESSFDNKQKTRTRKAIQNTKITNYFPVSKVAHFKKPDSCILRDSINHKNLNICTTKKSPNKRMKSKCCTKIGIEQNKTASSTSKRPKQFLSGIDSSSANCLNNEMISVMEKVMTPKHKQFDDSGSSNTGIILEKQTTQIESEDAILHVENENSELIFNLLTTNALAETGFTVCYREGFCLLNKENRTNCVPKGISLCAKYLDGSSKILYFTEQSLKIPNVQHTLLLLLSSFTRKICYESQAFMLFILDNIDVKDARVCYDWCILDPLVAGWLLDPDHPPSSFENLKKRFVNLEIKSNKNWLIECGRLLLLQSEVMEKLYTQLTKENIWDVFLYLETKIIPILAVMEMSEVKIDTEKVKKMSLLLKEKLNFIEKEAEKLVGHKFSLNSPEQLRKVLYEELKLDAVCNITVNQTTIKGVKSTSESMLKLLVNVHPLPNLVLEYRQLFKLKSAYTDAFLEHAKGGNCISAIWELCSTATGRVTSSNPNLQNIPKQITTVKLGQEEIHFNLRSCFLAREDCLLVSADFQHIELRVFAVLAKDKRLLSLLQRRGDIFNIITQIRLNKKEITTEERTQTKTLVYALMYGAGVKRIANMLGIDQTEAEATKQRFLGLFPALQNFNRKILNEVRKSNVLRSLSGRKRIFPNISSLNLIQRKSSERQALNFIIQGSAADICKGAMLRTELMLKEKNLNTKLLMQIHDELLWEVKCSEIAAFQEVVRESMEANRRFWVKKVNIDIPLPVSIIVGRDWGNMQ